MTQAITKAITQAITRHALVAAVLALFSVSSALADDFQVGAIRISTPWVRATPKGAPVGGGYMKVTNTGTAPDRLISGSSAIADKFELHEMSMAGGVMKMRPLKDGIDIRPGQTVELGPGGLHVMFVGLKQPLQQGQQVKATLLFEKAGKVEIDFSVEGIGAQAPHGAGGKH